MTIMASLFGLIILSFFITAILIVPFIDFLYRIKAQRKFQETRDPLNKKTPIFDRFNQEKVGTPVGGGALILLIVSVLTFWAYGILNVSINIWEIAVIFIGFLGFGMLGLYDDFKKMFYTKKPVFFGLRFRHKIIIQILIALIIAIIFYFRLGYTFIFIRGIGLANLGFLFIPFSAFIVVSFVNASNIADGLDGLDAGLFLICIVALLAISASQLDQELGIFLAVMVGCVGAFLYFNIYRARIWLGDVGSLALGATLGVTGLLTGKIIALAIIGGVFLLEIGSSFIQLMSKKYFGRKTFPVAPLHLWLQLRGWEEPKIVMRAWLIGFIFAILGLYIAFLK